METIPYESSNAGAAFGLGFSLFMLALCVFFIVCGWKIYTKAGEPGWACLIPFYSTIVMLKIVGKPWWWLLLSFIPFVNLVIAIWMVNLLSKSFGKGVGFTLGLLFLPFIFLPLMAFDKSIQYQGPAGDPSAGLQDQIQSIGSNPA